MTPPPRSGGAARAAPAGPRTLAAQGRAHARGGWPHRHGPAQLGAQAQLRAEGLQLRVTPRQTLARPKVQAALRARRASAPCHCARAPRLAAHWLCTEVPKSVAAGRLWQEARTKRARARARRAVLARGAGLAASPRPRRRAGRRLAAAAAAPASPPRGSPPTCAVPDGLASCIASAPAKQRAAGLRAATAHQGCRPKLGTTSALSAASWPTCAARACAWLTELRSEQGRNTPGSAC